MSYPCFLTLFISELILSLYFYFRKRRSPNWSTLKRCWTLSRPFLRCVKDVPNLSPSSWIHFCVAANSLRLLISSHFLSFPQDDPNPVVAMDHVVPMTGYYCKVCHKFYHNEVMAKVTHCRSKPHSAKYEVRFSFFVLWVTRVVKESKKRKY